MPNQLEAPTAEELELLRQYRKENCARFWSKQSPEERRQRRQRYAINAAKKRAAQRAAEERG